MNTEFWLIMIFVFDILSYIYMLFRDRKRMKLEREFSDLNFEYNCKMYLEKCRHHLEIEKIKRESRNEPN